MGKNHYKITAAENYCIFVNCTMQNINSQEWKENEIFKKIWNLWSLFSEWMHQTS